MSSFLRSRLGCIGLVLSVWFAPGVAAGGMVVRTWPAKVLDCPAGAGVIEVDLATLPKGARVYRARLLVDREAVAPTGPEALAANEVYALKAPFQAGGRPQPAGKPLPIAPLACDSFDAAAVVGRCAGGKCQLFVKSLPGWVKESTRLEVAHEGKARQVPTQVSGLIVFHRAGQTFITWKEVNPLITTEKATWGGVRKKLAAKEAFTYRIYAHNRPIDPKSIAQARPIARVGPLSGYNGNGRNMEYLICQAMVEPDKMGELCARHNHVMYTWGMNHPRMDRYPLRRFVIDEKAKPLPAGTGLYVHSSQAKGKTYYAVVSCNGGAENTTDFSPANALAKPVEETVGLGEPVHQGEGLWGPYFDYPGRRQVYVQWCAPPLAPRESMYFNWSVLAPTAAKKGRKIPAELYFHSGNFSYAKPRKKYMLHSIQIAPHDYPFSGWYGFNDAWGSLRSLRDGVVSNHTQKRIVAFLEWAKGRFPIDPARIILPGSDGAACLALNYREVFAYVMIQGFGGGGKVQGRVLNPNEAPAFASAWGPKSATIKDEKGRGNWGWAMLDQLALERPEVPIPLFTCAGTSWGGKRFYGSGFGPFYDAMMAAGQPVIGGHGWNCKLIPPNWYTGLWRGLDITNATPVIAFANSASSGMSLQSGNTNFNHQWKDVKDTPDSFEVFLHGGGKADVTPRRLQKFKVAPGERLKWETRPVPSRRDKTPKPQNGTVTVSKHGALTVKQVVIPRGGTLLKITRAK